MKQQPLWVIAALFWTGNSICLHADVVTNRPVADTSLFESNTNNNLGGWIDIPSGSTSGHIGQPYRSRGLLRFDLTAIPTNATVTSADLTVQLVKKPSVGPGSVFGLNRLLQAWGEGTGAQSSVGSPANSGEATWINRFHPSVPWAAPGGAAGVDYVGTASATMFMDSLGSYTFSSTTALVADVQSWVSNPATNFGWMLLSQDEGTLGTARRFASREDTFNPPPALVVHYTVSGPVNPPNIFETAVVGNQIRFSFTAEPNLTYAVERRLSLSTGGWETFMNIPAQSVPTTITVSDSLTNASSFYRVKTPNGP